MTGIIKKIYKWIIGILAAIGAFFVLIKTRDPSKMALEFERIKLENEIKEKEARHSLAKGQKEHKELAAELAELKKKKNSLIERLNKLTIIALIICVLFLPAGTLAQEINYELAYRQLQDDYYEALVISEEAIALANEYEALAKRFEALYLKTDDELSRVIEMNNELREWSEKLQAELLKSMKKRFGLSGGVLYHMSAPGLWAGITISF